MDFKYKPKPKGKFLKRTLQSKNIQIYIENFVNNSNIEGNPIVGAMGGKALVEPMAPVVVSNAKDLIMKHGPKVENPDYMEACIDPKQYELAFNFFDQKHIDEVCITFRPNIHDTNHMLLHGTVRDFLSKWSSRNYINETSCFEKVSYLFIPEYSKEGRLHYHGLVHFHEPLNQYSWAAKFKASLGKKFGRTAGKEVFNWKNYKKYISKDLPKLPNWLKPIYYIEFKR